MVVFTEVLVLANITEIAALLPRVRFPHCSNSRQSCDHNTTKKCSALSFKIESVTEVMQHSFAVARA